MIALYMGYCQSRQLREKTMLSYEQSLKLFAVWLQETEGITQVEQIKEGNIRRYIIELQTRGKYTFYSRKNSQAENEAKRRRDYNDQITNVTINNYLRNIRPFFSWLLEEEIIAKSPLAKVKELPQQRTAREYLSDDAVKRLLKSMDTSYFPEHRDKLVMMIMLDSGTRLGETLSIETEQIDLLGKTIHLPADKTKGRTARTVFFSNKVERELRRWLQYKDRYCESDYLFPVKHSGAMLQVADFEKNFRKYIKRVGIKKHISPHTLRNNFAKRCLLAGMDIFTLSRILGHSSVKVTEQAYLDVTEQDLKQQYDRFSPVDNIFRKRKK